MSLMVLGSGLSSIRRKGRSSVSLLIGVDGLAYKVYDCGSHSVSYHQSALFYFLKLNCYRETAFVSITISENANINCFVRVIWAVLEGNDE